MERLGILTGADLKAKSIVFLQEHFGKAGAWYYDISRGIDHRSVQPDRPLKSVGVEDTFSVDIVDLEAARAELTPLAAEVWRRCESKGLHGRTATLKVKYADFQIITRSRTMTGPIATADDLKALGQSLLESLFPTAKGIRLLGLTLSSFVDAEVSEANQLELQI